MATGGRRTCHFVALVDDFSRFLLGIRAVSSREALPILVALAETRGVPHGLVVNRVSLTFAARLGIARAFAL